MERETLYNIIGLTLLFAVAPLGFKIYPQQCQLVNQVPPSLLMNTHTHLHNRYTYIHIYLIIYIYDQILASLIINTAFLLAAHRRISSVLFCASRSCRLWLRLWQLWRWGPCFGLTVACLRRFFFWIYPLVNSHINMGNHHFYWVNPLFQWPFSIAM